MWKSINVNVDSYSLLKENLHRRSNRKCLPGCICQPKKKQKKSRDRTPVPARFDPPFQDVTKQKRGPCEKKIWLFKKKRNDVGLSLLSNTKMEVVKNIVVSVFTPVVAKNIITLTAMLLFFLPVLKNFSSLNHVKFKGKWQKYNYEKGNYTKIGSTKPLESPVESSSSL